MTSIVDPYGLHTRRMHTYVMHLFRGYGNEENLKKTEYSGMN